MAGNALRHLEELHNIMLECMIEGKKTAGRFYIRQIKCDIRANTFKELQVINQNVELKTNLRVEKKEKSKLILQYVCGFYFFYWFNRMEYWKVKRNSFTDLG